MGSGEHEWAELSEPLGRLLAELGVHLLTGAGRGVMTAVSRAFCEVQGRRGLSIGIVPSQEGSVQPKPGYPNPWVEVPIFTHLPLSGERGSEVGSRNHINVLSSNVVVALPGGRGTASEVRLALAYQRPVVAFIEASDQIPGLPQQVPICRELEGVREFVVAELRARGEPTA